MNKIITFLLIMLLFISCVEKKSVIDELKLNDVTKLIEQDSLYESIIFEIDSHKNLFENNIVMLSKFKELCS